MIQGRQNIFLAYHDPDLRFADIDCRLQFNMIETIVLEMSDLKKDNRFGWQRTFIYFTGGRDTRQQLREAKVCLWLKSLPNPGNEFIIYT